MELPSPAQIKHEYPLKNPGLIDRWRQTAKQILGRKDPRLAVIVGPCSVHDPVSALEFAHKLKTLSSEIEERCFLIMRMFIEKPRTLTGWKGMLYDPHLDGSCDLAAGLRKSRELLLHITELGVPCATELLDPLAAPYFDDLLTWGLIGARTSASQPHRQLASGLPFPVGFKNDFRGALDVAIAGIIASRLKHTHLALNPSGRICATTTPGNPHTHLVLRGSDTQPNFDPASVQSALSALAHSHLEPRLLIDCSHGNCGKDPRKQLIAFESTLQQAATNPSIAGLMLESHLYAGKQPLGDDPSLLHYGVSITDPCLDWPETESLLRSMSINSVQN